MSQDAEHYRRTVTRKSITRFARCGYQDRFDPFILSRSHRLRTLYAELFRTLLGEAPCARLLDMGCGTGIYFEMLAPHAKRVDAMDYSSHMITTAHRFCEQRKLKHFFSLQGSAAALPYPDNTFDVVVALDVLHHVERIDTCIREAWRVLQPGGHFLVFEPNIMNPLMLLAHLVPPEERRALSRNRPGTLRALLETYFETVRWQGVCDLITETSGPRRWLLDAYLALWRCTGCESLYPRQAWLGKKQDSTAL